MAEQLSVKAALPLAGRIATTSERYSDSLAPVHNPFIRTGVGVTKAPFVIFSVSKIFDLAKVPVRFFKSH